MRTSNISVKELISKAHEEGWAVGGYNMHSVETTQALLRAAEISNSPIFLQVGRAIIPHMGLKAAFEMTLRVAEESDAEFIIHLDHGSEEEVLQAIELGFSSIMFDGAHHPFEENIRVTRDIVKRCHDAGIFVEAELGKIPDAGQEVNWQSFYTDVHEAERFVAETGIDSLAISCGIVHGVPTGLNLEPLAIELVEKIRDVVPIPLVMHGASGVPDEEIRAVIGRGVHKINADSDLRHSFRRGIEEAWAGGDAQFEVAVAKGREYMIETTIEKMKLYGTAGRALKLTQIAVQNGRSW